MRAVFSVPQTDLWPIITEHERIVRQDLRKERIRLRRQAKRELGASFGQSEAALRFIRTLTFLASSIPDRRLASALREASENPDAHQQLRTRSPDRVLARADTRR